MKIGVIGAGAWGTALAIHFSRYVAHQVTLYARNAEHVQLMQTERVNARYFPEVGFPESLNIATYSVADFGEQDLLILAVPVSGLRAALHDWIQPSAKAIPILAACKGFEAETGLLVHQVMADILPENPYLGLLSGPSFALELAEGLPCAVCLASENTEWIETLAYGLNTSVMRLYANCDPTSVAVGGAVKNIMAITTGVLDGLHLGMNARAALMTRGLAEMSRLAEALGGDKTTLMGLSGMGDLILTCTGALSRNRQVGLKLAEGKSLPQILQELGHVAEGVNTLAAVLGVADRLGVDMPIAKVLSALLNCKIPIEDAADRLMLREPKFEA